MERLKSPPSALVGIVSNLLVMTLVYVLLYVGPGFKLPSLEQLANSIRQIAKTKKVTPDDLVALLGKPQFSVQPYDGYWYGTWSESIKSALNQVDRELAVTFFVTPVGSDNYMIGLKVTNTYRKGLNGQSFLTLPPQNESFSDALTLPLTKK